MSKVVWTALILTSLMIGAAVTPIVGLACSVRSWTTQSRRYLGDTVPREDTGVIPASWHAREFPGRPGAQMVGVDEYSGFGLQITQIMLAEMLPGGFSFDHQRYRRGPPHPGQQHH